MSDPNHPFLPPAPRPAAPAAVLAATLSLVTVHVPKGVPTLIL